MSKRIRAADGDHEMVRSTLDNLRSIGGNGCKWDMWIEDGGRTGVIVVVCTAYETLADGTTRRVGRVRSEWPNVHPVSLSAHLFRCAAQLAQMVDEWATMPF